MNESIFSFFQHNRHEKVLKQNKAYAKVLFSSSIEREEKNLSASNTGKIGCAHFQCFSAHCTDKNKQ